MCTVSFIPSSKGFVLVMNRDEQRTRTKGLAPDIHESGGLRALYPSEPSGGTWIGLNEAGLTIALINWYSKPQLTGAPAFSRGKIIPKLLTTGSASDAEPLLINLPLTQLDPFRIIMVSARTKSIDEFRSDARSLEKVSIPWKTHHWFSSGFDEPEIMRQRALTCSNEGNHSETDPLTRIRNLHRSHSPEKGPYSICMHREDACTVSCTELIVEDRIATMAYQEGSPCEEYPRITTSLTLNN
jgi:hypothetical protein